MTTRAAITTRLADLSREDDRAAFLALMDLFMADEFGAHGDWPPGVRDALVPAMLERPDVRVHFAEDGSAPIGFATCIDTFSTFWGRGAVNVHDLMVHPDQRGRGVGHVLMAAVERAARDAGCCKVTLEVRANNEVAKALYRKRGFSGHEAASHPGTLFWELSLRE